MTHGTGVSDHACDVIPSKWLLYDIAGPVFKITFKADQTYGFQNQPDGTITDQAKNILPLHWL